MTESPIVIWRVFEADGTAGEPARCTTVDGLISWDQEASESADAFEKRVVAEATTAGHRRLVMVPGVAIAEKSR